MRCLPTISFIGHHAFFIVHAHPCVLLKNMRLFGSHCIGLHIWVTATLTQLDSCVMTKVWSQMDRFVLSLTYPLLSVFKSCSTDCKECLQSHVSTRQQKRYLGGDTTYWVPNSDVIPKHSHYHHYSKRPYVLSTLENSPFFPSNNFQKSLLNTTICFSA